MQNIYLEVRDFILITLGLAIYAMAYTCFILPYQITTGGVAGIAAIVYYATGIEVQVTYLLINAAFLIAAIKILGWKFCLKTIYGVLMLTFLLWLFQRLIIQDDGSLPQVLGNESFMACVIGALLEGIALSFCFLNNGSTGGTDIIAAIVNKYKNMSLGVVLMICDVVIISSCYFVFDDLDTVHRVQKVVFGFSALIISSFTLDYVINRQRQSVQFMIFSRNYSKIADALNATGRGVTVLNGEGWYTKTERKVLVCLVKKRYSVEIFRLIKQIDPYAFLSMANVQGVYGEGFDQMKVKKMSKKKTIVFATNNAHKLEEVRAMLGEKYDIRSLDDIGCRSDIPETGDTFQENALQKAQFVKKYYGFDCFADDSGLEVAALDGAPGILSARYATEEGHDSAANNAKLLREMEGKTDRRADFRTVIAFIEGDTTTYFEGRVDGEILTELHGDGGFGYDPLFVPEGCELTFAEMTQEEKNAISHRGRAVAKFVEFLKSRE